MKEEMRACGICGKLHPVSELTEFDDALLCGACLHTETIHCQRCGKRIWADDNAGDGNMPLCQSCYDRYYTSCEDCGRVILTDDAYYQSDDDYVARCYSCHCRHQDDRCIQDYYYKPEPIFYGKGNRYFGVDLEIDDAGESNSNAAKIMDIANCGAECAYCKHDGSLESGFEIASHPMTLEYHLKEMPWGEMLAKAKELGYLSHKAGTCGLHVHVNRTAFGETEAEQDECIARVLYFFEKHWEELLKFSRRTKGQLQQWAARYGLKEHPKEILDHAKGNYERYTCINLTNRNTAEFRVFRGTLKANSLRATLELLDRICDGCQFALAHNGVLYNDLRLRKQHKLPATKIETDSYIATQLIESCDTLDFGSLQYMAEKLEGSFTFTVLSDKDDLWFIKGDNPMCLFHYPDRGLYVYASTEEILRTALRQLPFSLGTPVRVDLTCGDILRIDKQGHQERSNFDISKLFRHMYEPWMDSGFQSVFCDTSGDNESLYLEDLKSIAMFYGLYPEDIDSLINDGADPMEIEEMLYCG